MIIVCLFNAELTILCYKYKVSLSLFCLLWALSIILFSIATYQKKKKLNCLDNELIHVPFAQNQFNHLIFVSFMVFYFFKCSQMLYLCISQPHDDLK